MPRLSIVVPTYCEAENLPQLVSRIQAATEAAGIETELIIVDDDSPDATEAVCHRLATEFPLRLIIRRGERGLSSAVVAGLQAASGEILMVMDADLSHPPERIVDLVEALDDPGCNFVIGSRYVSGGTTSEDWGLFRWLNSQVATWLARPFTASKDPMAGFFALRRETFAAALPQLDPVGYKIGLELIVKGNCRRVAERPIHFADRQLGESKLNLREQLNYLRHLKRLYEYRFRDAAYLTQFLFVGASGMVVDLTVYAALLGSLATPVARAVAIWLAMTWNFLLNRKITFSYAQDRPWFRQYGSFCAACLVGALVNWTTSVTFTLSVDAMAQAPLVAALTGIIAGTLFNYTLSRYVVFRRGSDVATTRPTKDTDSAVVHSLPKRTSRKKAA